MGLGYRLRRRYRNLVRQARRIEALERNVKSTTRPGGEDDQLTRTFDLPGLRDPLRPDDRFGAFRCRARAATAICVADQFGNQCGSHRSRCKRGPATEAVAAIS